MAYHQQQRNTNLSTRRANNHHLTAKIAHISLPIAPLVRVTTGAVHPSFPTTILHYHLLTDAQLEDLAHFYHQRTPSFYTGQYPKTMGWKQGMGIQEKRRKFGKFVGLRGCESPVTTVRRTDEDVEKEWEMRWRTEEEILDAIVRETRMRIAEEDELMLRRKWY